MDARRLFKLLATRWWLIAIVAIAGATAAYYVTDRQNQSIEQSWEATAPVLILQTNKESDREYEARLRLAESRARIALQVQLTDSDTYELRANVPLGRLEFIARDGDDATAISLAEGLRAAYEAAEPGGDEAERLRSTLDSIAAQILELRNEKANLTKGTPLDPSVAAELTLMESQLSSLRQQAAALSLGLLFSELGTALDEEGNPRPADDVRQELAVVRDVITRLEDEYSKIRAANPGTPVADEDESLELLVLDQKIRDAESDYISTALLIEDFLGGGSAPVLRRDTLLADVTAIPNSPMQAGGIGFFLGAALALSVLIATDRLRQPILGTEDRLPLPVLAAVETSRPRASGDNPWYPDAGGPRRADIQALRASLDGATASGPVSIGVCGLGTSDAAVQELAADLASSVAASDRKVLLVDAVFSSPSELPEYDSGGKTLAEIVSFRVASEDASADIKRFIGDREPVAPELLAINAGHLTADPADVLAGRRFRELLDVARELVEVVIFATPHWGDPATDVLTQRLNHFVLVGRAGRTSAVDLEDVVDDLQGRSATPTGLALLTRRMLRPAPPQWSSPSGQTGAAAAMRQHAPAPDSGPALDIGEDPFARPAEAWERSEFPGNEDEGQQLQADSPATQTERAADSDADPAPAAASRSGLAALIRRTKKPPGPGAAGETLAAETLAAETLAAETLAAETLAAETLAAETGAAIGTDGERAAAKPQPEEEEPSEVGAEQSDAVTAELDRISELRPTAGHMTVAGHVPELQAESAPPESANEAVHHRMLRRWARQSGRPQGEAVDRTDQPVSSEQLHADYGEPGEAFLLERVTHLVKHGIDRPSIAGHPAGTLLLTPGGGAESAASLLYGAVFVADENRSEELKQSLGRVLAIKTGTGAETRAPSDADWWSQAIGLDADHSRRQELMSALDSWLRWRLVGVQAKVAGEPTTLYIASALATFQALVHAPSFDSVRALSLRGSAVTRVIERLRMELWKESRENPEVADAIRAEIADIEEFDLALQGLATNPPGEPLTWDQLEEAGILASSSV